MTFLGSPLSTTPDPIVMLTTSQSRHVFLAGHAGMSCATSMVSTSWMRPMWRRMALNPPSPRRMHTLPAGLSGMMPLWTGACAWYSTAQLHGPPAWAVLLFLDFDQFFCTHREIASPTSCGQAVVSCPSSRSSLLRKAEQLLYACTAACAWHMCKLQFW